MANLDIVGLLLDSTLGLANLGLNIFDTVSRNKTNKSNLQLQKDIFAWQKQTQQDIFKREDNAVQRRVDDLRAAGLSPTLAAGSGAGAGAAVPVTTPQREHTPWNNILIGVALRKTIAEYAQTKAQADLIKQQAISQQIDNRTRSDFNLTTIESMKQNISHIKQQMNEIDARIGYTRAGTSHYNIQAQLARGQITHWEAQEKEIEARIRHVEEQIEESKTRRNATETSRFGNELQNLKELRSQLHDLKMGLQGNRLGSATNLGTWRELFRASHHDEYEKELDRMIMEMLKSETTRRYE